MKNIYISLLTICFFVPSYLFSQKYFFEKISPESGFTFEAINTICEDCNGMVWFGNNDGLYFYNTSSVEKIKLEKYPQQNSNSQSILINKIYKDANCNIWVCTQNGLYRRNNNENTFTKVLFTNNNSDDTVKSIIQFNQNIFYVIIGGELFYFSLGDKTLHKVTYSETVNENISYIGKNQKGNLLVGTTAGKMYIGISPYADFELIYKSKNYKITTICDNNDTYLIGYENNGAIEISHNGIKQHEYNNNLNDKYHLPSNRVRDIIKTDSGDIWIATFKGILVINNQTTQLISSSKNTGLPSNSIYDLHKGSNGGIWIGTWTGGLTYFRDINYRFHHIKKVPNELEKEKSVISSFIEDKNGDIWIGNEQTGINRFSIKNHHFLPNLPSLLSDELRGIKSFTKNENNQIIIGTVYQGIWLYNQDYQSISKMNIIPSIDSAVISTMAVSENDLWIASRGTSVGLTKFNTKTRELKSYSLPTEGKKKPLRVWKLLIDSRQRLWICTTKGLIYKDNHEDILHQKFKNDTIYNLNNALIYTAFEDHNLDIWIGTRSKGIYKYNYKRDELKQIAEDNITLCHSDIYGIIQDKENNIWMSTNKGIYKHSIKTNKTTNYSVYDGISGNQFLPNASYLCNNGEIFFGSPNGLCYINPKEIKTNTIAPKVFLSKLLINNKPFAEIENIQTNSLVAAEVKNLTLKHHQNSLTFGVVSNNYIKPKKNKFRYRLIDYNNEWIEIDHNKDITFTKIPPGKYSLQILASNNDDIWRLVPLTIDITILPPIWARWYAILLYTVITLILLTLVRKELLLKIKLREEVLTEKFKGEANKEVFEEKLRFFTNISHEIRTPLTLIISPLNNLLKKFKYDESTNQQLLVMKRNSSRLLRLTNQILDFRLLEVGKLKANFQKTDIVDICQEVYTCFELLILEKHINFMFNSSFKSLWITIDPDMIEKIIYNLVSNAIKFSEEKGQIFLTVEKQDLTEESYKGYVTNGQLFTGPSIEIKVRDFGKGIDAQLLPQILDRFIFSPQKNNTGSGIGLHLCKEYAKLNNGNILIASEENQGATFILNIPLQRNFEYEEKSIVNQIINSSGDEIHKVEADLILKGNKPVLLLAEDNDELRLYMKDFLMNYYKVITAKNGQQAFEIAKEIQPNILISDILMPSVDGIELVKKMKNDAQTTNIPIIILTALSESKYQKESLMEGVDSYLTKPVDETLLLAQIENILSKMKIFSKQQDAKDEPDSLNNDDLSIIEKVEKLTEENLSHTDFGIDNVLNKLNISRSTLHRKVKGSTGQSPTEFIRDIRLKNAIRLMKTHNYNIDEIGTYVGFNSTSYFIRSFKKKYGKTPKDYYLNHIKSFSAKL